MVDSVRRGGAIAVALTVMGLASALAACASSTTVSPAAGGTTASGTATSSAQSAPLVPVPSPTTSQSVNPGGRMSPMPSLSPSAATQVTEPPSTAKYVPIDKATRSSDGRTLYLQIEARGGACGNYLVVVQQSTSRVSVGLAQLPVRTGVMCPMYIGPRIFPATLSSPLGSRPLVDLANGATLGP